MRCNTSINRCSLLFVVIRSRAQRDLFDEIAYVRLLREENIQGLTAILRINSKR